MEKISIDTTTVLLENSIREDAIWAYKSADRHEIES